MKIIKDLIQHMYDTLDEAEEYAMEAKIIKNDYPNLATIYIQLGEEHLDHYMKLHNQVVNLLNDYKRNSGEPPETMKIIWDYEHERTIKCYNDIKRSLNDSKSM